MCIPHVLTRLSGKTDFIILGPGYIKIELGKKDLKKDENKNVDAKCDFGYVINVWSKTGFYSLCID